MFVLKLLIGIPILKTFLLTEKICLTLFILGQDR
jgi:hypothetical protein